MPSNKRHPSEKRSGMDKRENRAEAMQMPFDLTSVLIGYGAKSRQREVLESIILTRPISSWQPFEIDLAKRLAAKVVALEEMDRMIEVEGDVVTNAGGYSVISPRAQLKLAREQEVIRYARTLGLTAGMRRVMQADEVQHSKAVDKAHQVARAADDDDLLA
ncbi:hypothetical protein [Pseudomonas sp. 18173]|uniref:hypothetical protein n=1 Tax=Pseudomonas sp. 18173 TaxID=3390055 RepID=UPI003D2144C8